MTKNRTALLLAAAIFLAVLGACGLGFVLVNRANSAARSTVEPTAPAVLHDQEFRGHFVSSFEVSSFTPCGGAGPATPGYDGGYWVSSTPESGFYDQYSALTSKNGASQPAGVVVYAHFLGDLVGGDGNGFGHLNGYAHEITVTQVLEMSVEGVC